MMIGGFGWWNDECIMLNVELRMGCGMRKREELFCHACNRYVQFEIDINNDGNYTIPCPNCGHDHYRVVSGGLVTDERWQSSGGFVQISGATSSTQSSTCNYYSASTATYTTGTGTWS